MSHRPVTRSQITKNPSLLVSPLGIVQVANQLVTVPLPPPVSLTMLLGANRNYVPWDARSPLVALVAPILWDAISISALKAIPKFIRDGSRTPAKHLQDVVDVCLEHGITTHNVVLRLFVAYF